MLKVHNLHNAPLMMHSRKVLHGNGLGADLGGEIGSRKIVKVNTRLVSRERIGGFAWLRETPRGRGEELKALNCITSNSRSGLEGACADVSR